MDCPGFQVRSYGIYDSRVAVPKLTHSAPRRVTRFELELITEDLTGTAYIDDTPYPLRKGLFICSKPGQLRYSHMPMYCHYIHLQTEDPVLEQLLQQLPDGCRLSNFSQIHQVFQELVSLPAGGKTDALLLASLVLRLLSLVQQMTTLELRSNGTFSPSHRAMLLETESYIRDHLAEDLSLELLASRAKFSPSHFHRVFTAWAGKTPHEFILNCRIEAAKAALRSDRYSLIELASACGFSSQSHFSAQFKKATGQTPLAYRKAKLSRLEP